jgi:hypothetical protein
MGSFAILVGCVLQLMIFCFPVSLLLLGFWVWAMATTCRRPEYADSNIMAGCLAKFLTPIGVLVAGAAFTDCGSDTVANMTGFGSILLHIGLSIFLFAKWPNALRAVFASLALSGYMGLVANFVASQAVIGIWL